MQHKKHVWHAIIDLHCSDRDGQRWQDWHHNTHGKNVMCKFMVNASAQMTELEEMATACETQNPHTCQLHKWIVLFLKTMQGSTNYE